MFLACDRIYMIQMKYIMTEKGFPLLALNYSSKDKINLISIQTNIIDLSSINEKLDIGNSCFIV
jgi:hypothetical protein